MQSEHASQALNCEAQPGSLPQMGSVAMSSLSRAQLLSDLQDRIRQLEDRTPATGRRQIDLGIAAIEGWLPNSKVASGSLVELLPLADGAGALTLALFMAKQACCEQ